MSVLIWLIFITLLKFQLAITRSNHYLCINYFLTTIYVLITI